MSRTTLSRRARPILARWLSLMVCGFIAALVWFLIEDALRPLFDQISARLGYLPPTIGFGAMLAVVSFLSWRLGRGRWRGFLGLNRYFVSFPPLWVAFIFTGIASGCMAILEPGFQETSEALKTQVASVGWYLREVQLWFWFVIIALPLLSIFAVRFTERARTARPKPLSSENQQDISPQLRELIEWMRDDGEIKHPDSDYFQHDVVAQRIVHRLTTAADDAPTMAVVGPFGSGKSSICNLVAHHLKDDPRTHLVKVSLWPFDSSEAAAAGILSKVIRTLGQHVNTLSLTGLPAQYVSIIEGVSGRWGGVARLLRPNSSPEEILKRISTVATASGMHLVLWIEDLERFSARYTSADTSLAERQSERLAPIHSLLHLLDRCASVSVIVADTSLETRIDIGKIARYVERPPRPTPEDVWSKTTALRSECRGGYPRVVYHPASQEHHRLLAPVDNEITEYIQFHQEHNSQLHVKAAFVELLDTPRAFKTALRLTCETWEQLAGEIDFDDVLIASALREARPKVFEFIEKNIRPLRSGFGEKGGKKDDNQVLKDLETLLNQEQDARKQLAIRTLLYYLFPKLESLYVSDIEDSFVDRPQGLGSLSHVDYWERYLALPDVTGVDSDQAALRSIAGWKNGEKTDLIDRLMDPHRSGTVTCFVGQFTGAELCRLLEEMLGVLQQETARDWSDREHAPGIPSLRSMMVHCRPPEKMLADLLLKLTNELVPRHLPLANELYYWMANHYRGGPELIDREARELVRARFVAVLKETFKQGAASKLLAAVQGGSPYIVYLVCWGPDRLRDGKTDGLPFEGWDLFSEILLEAAESDQTYGLPLIVPFITDWDRVHARDRSDVTNGAKTATEHQSTFDEEAAQRLFHFDRLIKLLATAGAAPPHLSDEMRIAFAVAVEAARAHLENQESTKPPPAIQVMKTQADLEETQESAGT